MYFNDILENGPLKSTVKENINTGNLLFVDYLIPEEAIPHWNK
jgi:hypothetical protein